ncbi:nucleolar protein 12 [Betta splendens]|uniref:Nucleolar protein 12 n=1 Tax=Betta splendens TaxID=158456 RepID=A0A6P7N8U5_BETSP|nr:nucleolar protein 12 [Betta splendens]
MKNSKKHNGVSKNAKFKPGSKKRENKCVVMFDDKDRQEYLTGFHKRKVERRKAAVAELRKKIKEEQTKVREERRKEYMKMLKERKEALEDAEDDDLENVITSTTESVQYDHPNHTVTVTTISDLDLTGAHILGPATQANEESDGEENGEEEEKTAALPRKAGNSFMNKKIRSLTATLSTYTSKRRRKGKQDRRAERGHRADKSANVTEGKSKASKSSKRHRRRQTGKREQHHRD